MPRKPKPPSMHAVINQETKTNRWTMYVPQHNHVHICFFVCYTTTLALVFQSYINPQCSSHVQVQHMTQTINMMLLTSRNTSTRSIENATEIVPHMVLMLSTYGGSGHLLRVAIKRELQVDKKPTLREIEGYVPQRLDLVSKLQKPVRA